MKIGAQKICPCTEQCMVGRTDEMYYNITNSKKGIY